MSRAVRIAPVLALVMLATGMLVAPALAAQTYTVTVHTDHPSYSGSTPIHITGVVSPAPGAGTAVVITILNSAGTLADTSEASVSATTGDFNYTSVPGGMAAWTSGTFTINATWGGPGGSASGTTTFVYSPTSSTTSSSSSSSSSSSTSMASSSSTTSSSTPSSTTSTQTTSSSAVAVASSTATGTSSSSSTSGGGSGSLTYILVAALVVIVVVVGVLMWRRRVAGSFGAKSAK